jgi:hypothetical protein
VSDGEGTGGGSVDLPKVDFTTFVLSLSHSVLVHLGDAPDPEGGRFSPNPALARQTIDLLILLEEKTQGNLSGDEERLMTQVVYDLQMRFIEVSKSTK